MKKTPFSTSLLMPIPPPSWRKFEPLSDTYDPEVIEFVELYGYLKSGTRTSDPSKVKELRCYNQKLKHLPEHIGQLDTVRHIHCGNNQLTELPASIGNMKQLSSLNCQYNHLKSLPESLGKLKFLQTLNCHGNQISVIPYGLWSIKNLSCSYNRLKYLPPTMSKENVERNMAGNEFIYVPFLDTLKGRLRIQIETRALIFMMRYNEFVFGMKARMPPELSELIFSIQEQIPVSVIRKLKNTDKTLNDIDLEILTQKDLKSLLKMQGKPVTGKKNELIKRLVSDKETKPDYSKMTVRQLKIELNKRNLSTYGLKKELIERLENGL